MNSQSGLINLWTQGDLVTRVVALILLGMSLVSWMVILVKALNLRRTAKLALRVETFWLTHDFAEGLRALGGAADNPFYQLAQQGHEALAHLHAKESQSRLSSALDASDWVTHGLRNAIDKATAELQSGLAVLASVGSTAPFVGLFGTVWGIYHALLAIGLAGESTIDKVAGPIGEALIMTALGLAVAIPAVLGYNALVRGNKSVLAKLNSFAYDLHAMLLTGSRIGSHGTVSSANVLPIRKV